MPPVKEILKKDFSVFDISETVEQHTMTEKVEPKSHKSMEKKHIYLHLNM